MTSIRRSDPLDYSTDDDDDTYHDDDSICSEMSSCHSDVNEEKENLLTLHEILTKYCPTSKQEKESMIQNLLADSQKLSRIRRESRMRTHASDAEEEKEDNGDAICAPSLTSKRKPVQIMQRQRTNEAPKVDVPSKNLSCNGRPHNNTQMKSNKFIANKSSNFKGSENGKEGENITTVQTIKILKRPEQPQAQAPINIQPKIFPAMNNPNKNTLQDENNNDDKKMSKHGYENHKHQINNDNPNNNNNNNHLYKAHGKHQHDNPYNKKFNGSNYKGNNARRDYTDDSYDVSNKHEPSYNSNRGFDKHPNNELSDHSYNGNNKYNGNVGYNGRNKYNGNGVYNGNGGYNGYKNRHQKNFDNSDKHYQPKYSDNSYNNSNHSDQSYNDANNQYSLSFCNVKSKHDTTLKPYKNTYKQGK